MSADRQTDAPSPSGRASDFDSDRLGSSPRGATKFLDGEEIARRIEVQQPPPNAVPLATVLWLIGRQK